MCTNGRSTNRRAGSSGSCRQESVLIEAVDETIDGAAIGAMETAYASGR